MDIKRKLQSKILDLKQKHINQKYAKEGLTDEVLRRQVQINSKRNELNILDLKENEGEFVQ